MKIHGEKIEGPNVEVVVIPRLNKEIVFKAQAVLDYTAFDALCPTPEPPVTVFKDGRKARNPEDPDFAKDLDKWATLRTHWTFLKSLSATEGLTWDSVDFSKPDTWSLYQKELQESGFSPAELSRIMQAVTNACGLNQSKIDEATSRFLASQAAMQKQQ